MGLVFCLDLREKEIHWIRESGTKKVLTGKSGEPNLTRLKEMVVYVKICADVQEPNSEENESRKHALTMTYMRKSFVSKDVMWQCGSRIGSK